MRIVAGKFRGKALLSPTDDSIRPTSDRARESVFNILASRIGVHLDGLKVLDLFAGTGALGLEAISRGASGAVFVDTGAEARGIIRDHIEAFGIAGIAKLLRRDATARLQRAPLGRVVLARDLLGIFAAVALLTVPGWTAWLAAFAGEVLERHLFFRAVDAPKMPGMPP